MCGAGYPGSFLLGRTLGAHAFPTGPRAFLQTGARGKGHSGVILKSKETKRCEEVNLVGGSFFAVCDQMFCRGASLLWLFVIESMDTRGEY